MSASRLLILVATALLCCTALANETLYKWREADGTLTFSRTPPASDSGIVYERVETGNGIELAKPGPAISGESTVASATGPAVASAPDRQRIAPASAKRKSTQCGELQKRVLSLERLIRTDVSAEAMDNAIVQMARYQASFNQSCNRM